MSIWLISPKFRDVEKNSQTLTFFSQIHESDAIDNNVR